MTTDEEMLPLAVESVEITRRRVPTGLVRVRVVPETRNSANLLTQLGRGGEAAEATAAPSTPTIGPAPADVTATPETMPTARMGAMSEPARTGRPKHRHPPSMWRVMSSAIFCAVSSAGSRASKRPCLSIR